ncbi:MAG: phytanoyl-CoA dioxygenase family protein [Planctomycetes bacterium]|nr:phytanoyl-CoA dioxygenase family protein [Planctomycetota bacterium]
MSIISEQQWAQYEEQGFLKLGRVVSEEVIEALRQRIDAIMHGTAAVDTDKLLMQLDSDNGAYDDAGEQSSGHKGDTLNYRKIQDLEHDDLFMSYMQQPIFREICARSYGADADIDIFRAMFMNKPSGKGTFLPWHQDRWSNLDRDPLVTLWTALDPATIENGCVEILPGTHKRLINPDHPSGFLEPEMIVPFEPEKNKVYVELAVGESVLLHNWLLHSSNKNNSLQSRRAFSTCYMDAQTQVTEAGAAYEYNRIFSSNEVSIS